MKNIIFYFSGSGNSAFIAKAIAEQLGNCEAIEMFRFKLESEIEANTIGFAFPVYWWGLPNFVSRFISNIKVKNVSYVFVAATIGSSSGNAIPQAKDLFEKKGIKLAAGFDYIMPDNNITLQNAPKKKKQKQLIDVAYEKSLKDVETIKERKELSIKKESAFIRRVNRHFIGTYATLDKKFWTSYDCSHCGLCTHECPVQNIQIIDGKPTWKHSCESCMKCIQRCPQEAINYGRKTEKRTRYSLDYDNFKAAMSTARGH